MPMWTYSLKSSLRSLARELVRNLWGRVFIYPTLAANEGSREALAAYVARRARAVQVPLDGDGSTLPRLAPTTPMLTKHEVRQHPERLVRPRGPGSWLRSAVK